MSKDESAGQPPDVTQLLLAWRRGDEQAFSDLMPLVYEELRSLAKKHLRRERPGNTLQATALANEAYLRLVDTRQVQWRDRAHFFAMASRIMRRVLVDAARTRNAGKRGGGAAHVTFDETVQGPAERAVDLMALDAALDQLEALDGRKARVVELRVFGGLTLQETAAALEISPDTVARDWNFVKSWLRRELRVESRP
jgi:RNA polymerase sigma-70 factor, ECF subfamily